MEIYVKNTLKKKIKINTPSGKIELLPEDEFSYGEYDESLDDYIINCLKKELKVWQNI